MQVLNPVELLLLLSFAVLFLSATVIIALCIKTSGMCRLPRRKSKEPPALDAALRRAAHPDRQTSDLAGHPYPIMTPGNARPIWIDARALARQEMACCPLPPDIVQGDGA